MRKSKSIETVMASEPILSTSNGEGDSSSHMRYLDEHNHLGTAFGDNWFGAKAEQFARLFGTPRFIIGQTIFVAVWIILNVAGVFHFDLYPFILLNLAFSTQAAYAAPLILLAQTRQADRDKAHSEADAKHRDDVAIDAAKQALALLKLIKQETELTKSIREMNQRIEKLTQEIHAKVIN